MTAIQDVTQHYLRVSTEIPENSELAREIFSSALDSSEVVALVTHSEHGAYVDFHPSRKREAKILARDVREAEKRYRKIVQRRAARGLPV